jgi:hypothetical protein
VSSSWNQVLVDEFLAGAQLLAPCFVDAGARLLAATQFLEWMMENSKG